MKNRFNTGHRILALLLIALSVVTGTSCFKMRYSTTGASIPIEAKTVSVQYFENMAIIVEAGLSQQITDNLRDYLQGNTNLILVTGTGDCDFEGAITAYDTRPVAITAGDEAAKNRFSITLKVKFTCEVKPELNFESSFSRYEDYSSDLDFESIKVRATEEILKLLIEDIFNRAFVNW